MFHPVSYTAAVPFELALIGALVHAALAGSVSGMCDGAASLLLFAAFVFVHGSAAAGVGLVLSSMLQVRTAAVAINCLVFVTVL